MKNRQENQNHDLMSKDPLNWKGPIYLNKKDSRIIVPKKYPGIGWTLNFGNIFALIIFILFIVTVVVVTIVAK
jgi:uncharacterized membrane protein